MSGNSLFEIFIFLVAACSIVPLTSRFKLGAVSGYLAAGIIIGPFGFAFITDAEKLRHFAEFGVVMMLFVIGLELEPAALWRLRRSIIGLGGLQVALTSVVFSIIGITLGYSWQTSLTVGLALSLSSTALVLQILNEKNLMHTSVGESSFAVLLFQDIAVIPILILIPLLAVAGVDSHASNSLIAQWPNWLQAIIIATVIVGMIAGGRYLSHHLFRVIAKTNLREIFTALSLALIIGITLLMQMIGISPALGAFIAGVVLANSEYRRTLETDIEPFKGLLLGLFFISVGMGIDFKMLNAQPLTILGVVICLMAIKALILYSLGRYFDIATSQRLGFAFILSQGGEFAFVLFQLAGGLKILAPEQEKFLILVVAISIAATPFLMLWYNRFIVPRFMSALPERDYDIIDQQHSVILAGFGRFGQVVGRFISGQGVKLTVLEKNPDQIDLIRKFGFKGYYGDATRLDVLRSAGASTAQLLIIAVDQVEDSLAIAEMAKAEFPNLTIFARARNRQHAYDLHRLGVQHFKRELFESSLEMAKEIMLWLGKPEHDVKLKAKQFRKHDENTLQESFKFFDDEKMLINYAKTRRAELEQILQSDSAELNDK